MDSQSTRAAAEELERERRRLLEQLLADEGLDEGTSSSAIAPRAAGAPVPATYAQEVLWLLDRATPGLTAYNSPLARRVRGPLDVAALERALGALAARHEALRTVFEARGDEAGQVVLDAAPVALAVHDVRSVAEAEREEAALSALRAVANTPFDLTREPGFRAALAKLADDDHVLLLLTHHIVSDAWSYGVIFRDLNALYEAELHKVPSTLSAPPLQYGDYAAWQRSTLVGETLEQGLGFWRGRLADLPVLELPTEFARPTTQSFMGARRTLVLSPALHGAVRALAQRSGATTYMVLLAAYATVLRRYAAQDDIVIGSAVAGRTRREIEEMVGYFSQALPMRVRLEGDPTVAELLARTTETVLGAFEHQDTPLESLVLELQKGRAQSHAPLFRVVLTMQDTLGAELAFGGATVTPVEVDAAGTKFDLTILATERADGLGLALWYRTDLFTGAYAERFLGHLRTVLEAMAANPSQRVSTLPLLTESERAQLAAWNDTSVDEAPASAGVTSAATLVELFEAQAARVPSRAAVVAPRAGAMAQGSVAGAQVLTYAELNARANQLARRLRSLGVGADQPVALGLDRSADALVGLLGILKAGGAYVPLPPELPAARRTQQLRESGARMLVTLAAHAGAAPSDVTVVTLDGDAAALSAYSADNIGSADFADSADFNSSAKSAQSADKPAERLAYVLYTSGSTGTPKGVAVTHANAVHYARAISRVLADVPHGTPGDGFGAMDGWQFGMVSTLGADLGNTSLLPSLLSGGTLHVIASEVTNDPARFAEYTAVHQLDVLKITPNHFMALAASKRGEELAAILPKRWLVTGGEALRPDVARAVLGANRCRLLNHYGPTETTVGACTFEATNASVDAATAQGAQTIPVGRPLANMHAYVASVDGTEQPVVIPGELLLGGAGVARGYLKRDDLTAERFAPTFAGVTGVPERVYRTGDRVRRLADGTIEFLGRADDQVKVRGYRVELGEVESALRAHPGVGSAVAVLRDDDGDARLVAYAVPKQAGYAVSHSDRPTSEKLVDWVAAQVPEYMVPSAVVLLDALPLTANGKVDKRALPAPDAPAEVADTFAEPVTETQRTLAAIWADVLKKDRVGLGDNFLALGGHSLLAIRALGKISKSFGVRLPLRTLFEAGTLEQLAGAVDRAVAER